MRIVPAAPLALLFLLGVGCIYDSSRTAPGRDRAGDAPQPGLEPAADQAGLADARRADVGRRDVAQKPDPGAADKKPVDGPPVKPDSKPKPDSAWGTKDKPQPDAPPPAACLSGTASSPISGTGVLMVACTSSNPLTPCSATGLCMSPTFSLCTPTQYQAVFPTSGPPPPAAFQDAWLQACVTDAGYGITLQESNCGNGTGCICTGTTVNAFGSMCAGGSPVSFLCAAVGVTSSAACVGIPVGQQQQGYWYPTRADGVAPISKALCCHSLSSP